jgi:3-hydroxybutyryl-CoA dehydrogenase
MVKLGIAGARGVGASLAQLALQRGHRVVLFDQSSENLNEARQRIARVLEAPPVDAESPARDPGSLQRLESVTEIGGLAEAEIVIETVVDSRESKRAVLSRLAAACPETAVVVTTTGTLSITNLAAMIGHPERVIGIHFPRPVASTAIAEVVAGLRTNESTIAQALALVRSLDKTPIQVKNRPGFLVNRLANLFRLEAVRLLEEEVADSVTVDALLTALGFSSGPLAQMDALGVDACLAMSRALYEGNLGEPRYQPSLLQAEMVDAGLNGRKAGKGFHEYPAR